MRVVAFGRTQILAKTIEKLVEAGHEVACIGTCRPAPEYSVRQDTFRQMASRLGADFFETQDINAPEIIGRLAVAGARVAVSVNWVSLVGEEVCGLFPFGVLNAHAGDLPRYRGNAPVAWAILEGEEYVGVTIHQMDPCKLDATCTEHGSNPHKPGTFLWIVSPSNTCADAGLDFASCLARIHAWNCLSPLLANMFQYQRRCDGLTTSGR